MLVNPTAPDIVHSAHVLMLAFAGITGRNPGMSR
jgi:hypothetical protein